MQKSLHLENLPVKRRKFEQGHLFNPNPDQKIYKALQPGIGYSLIINDKYYIFTGLLTFGKVSFNQLGVININRVISKPKKVTKAASTLKKSKIEVTPKEQMKEEFSTIYADKIYITNKKLVNPMWNNELEETLYNNSILNYQNCRKATLKENFNTSYIFF